MERELRDELENGFSRESKTIKKVDAKKIFLAVGLMVGSLAFNKFVNTGLGNMVSNLIPNRYFVSFFTELLFALFVVVMILLQKKKSVFRYSAETFANGLRSGSVILAFGLLGVLLAIVNFPGHELIKSYEIIFFVLECFLIGVAEEGLFRGIVQELCLDAIGAETRKKQIISIVVAAGLFGFVHILNIFAGVTPGAVISQAINAVGIGTLLGAICFHSKRTLWPVILLHGFMDFGSFVGNGLLWGTTEVEAVNGLSQTPLSGLIFFCIFVFLMRPVKGEKQEEMESEIAPQKIGEIETEKSLEPGKAQATGRIGKIVAGIVISLIGVFVLLLLIPFFMAL